MSIKRIMKILVIIVGIFLLSLLLGCSLTGNDKIEIEKIAKNIEETIEGKDVELFMDNISDNYSDSQGGTYENHINGLPEEIFSNIEENEDLVDGIFSIFKIEEEVTIPKDEIIITEDIYASGKMEIKISLKACIAWVICTDLYNETINYDVDFIKENDDWKIISMEEV